MPTRRLKTLFSLLLALCLAAFACGSDDGPSSPEDVLEDIISGDFDPGDLEDIDLSDIDVGDIDLDDIEDQLEGLEDFAGDLSSGGGGEVTIEGVTYAFDAEYCFVFDDDIQASGPGVGSDGTPAWVEVSYSRDTAEELAEFLGEEGVELLYPGQDVIETLIVSVEPGKDGIYGSGPDDQPSWYAGNEFSDNPLEWQVDGSSISGSGQIGDDNYVVLDFPDTVPFTFQASCDQ